MAETVTPASKATLKYLRASAYKVREVLALIRGLDVEEARHVLTFCDRGAARDVLKVLNSAVANAEHTKDLPADELFVSVAFADEGPTIKRWRPRARGRATRIRKRTSHITIVVARLSDEQLQIRRRKEAAAGGGAGARRRGVIPGRRRRTEEKPAAAPAKGAAATAEEAAPVEETAPVEEAPVEEAPLEEAQSEAPPVDEAVVEEAVVEEAVVEEAPVEATTSEDAGPEETAEEKAARYANLGREEAPEAEAAPEAGEEGEQK